MPCHGNSEGHCCWLEGQVCKYLEKHPRSKRVWVCGLRRKLGNWDAVLESPEYLRDVAPKLRPGINCRDWPDKPFQKCFECGFGVVKSDHGSEKWL